MVVKQSRANQGFLTKDELAAEKRDLKAPLDESVWSRFNETQLWFLSLGLDRLELAPELQVGAQALAKRIERYGRKRYGWHV